ncbi:NAD(P)-dependent alcohol dehydrogenase [Mucilaginibacter gynuensis]|uniref:NAD(P)-dependent alcohol dehydrogenase n=1 Tax=Mucilaginibacter gynuensis TaxID=1302236 RepID=A0ABP8G6C4_9SPHI
MTKVNAWAQMEPNGKLVPYTYELTPVDAEEVEVEIDNCGLCHTDLSALNGDFGLPRPIVAGHEITGRIVALGEVAKNKGLSVGQTVGIGWNKESCGHCDQCLNGDPHLCVNLKTIILGSNGGFSSRIKAHWLWVIPVPEGIDAADAGPLFCAGITVFYPLLEYGLKPTDKVAVFGIGGLGHLAVQFAHAWGSEVTAFSSTAAKHDETLKLGADRIVSSRDSAGWEHLKGTFDLIIVTVSVSLEWDKIIAMLAPKGRLHFVGIPYEAIPVSVLSLLIPQTSVSASPAGSRSAFKKMLDFASRHKIKAMIEHFPMSKINDAIEHLESGKANYRVVLDADF